MLILCVVKPQILFRQFVFLCCSYCGRSHIVYTGVVLLTPSKGNYIYTILIIYKGNHHDTLCILYLTFSDNKQILQIKQISKK